MSGFEVFDRNRPLLFSISYRMMGSVMEAEDVVQEAFLRWQRATEEVRYPSAYLSKVATRLCIDRLRSARARRERYVGTWLPEPLLGEQAQEVAPVAELDDSLSMAFLVLLESLTPVERAVFLLREVFDYEYAEIGFFIGKSEANCRQISHRARQAVAARRPRFESSPEQERRLMDGFLEATLSGNMEALLGLLSEDVSSTPTAEGRRRPRATLSTARTKSPGFATGYTGRPRRKSSSGECRPTESRTPPVTWPTIVAGPSSPPKWRR